MASDGIDEVTDPHQHGMPNDAVQVCGRVRSTAILDLGISGAAVVRFVTVAGGGMVVCRDTADGFSVCVAGVRPSNTIRRFGLTAVDGDTNVVRDSGIVGAMNVDMSTLR